MEIIVVIGRGGTGKTSFTALLAKYCIETGKVPLLLIDLDPDQNLAEMVGIDLEDKGVLTVADLIEETFLSRGGTTIGISPYERIEAKIWEKGMYEGKDFDLISVGTKWVEGCYCLPDAAIKKAVSALSSHYRYVIIDSPAGLEHLNRKVTTKADIFIDLMGPSNKSFQHVKRAHRIIRELAISYRHFYTLGGCQFPGDLAAEAEKITGFPFIGKIAFDAALQERVIHGESLLSLPDESIAYMSVKTIMKRILSEQ